MSTIVTKEISTIGGRKTWSLEIFDSPLEVVEINEHRYSITDSRFDNVRPGKDYVDPEWRGVHNYEEATDLMVNGYNPLVKELEGITADVMGEGKRISFTNSVHGFAPVVPLALMGVPNSMRDVRMKPCKTKVMDVYYLNGVSAAYSTTQMIRAGKQLIKALLSLELGGYKFNVYTFNDFARPEAPKANGMLIKIKSSSRPLDFRKMSFTLAHPAALRVIAFDWYSRFPRGAYLSGYGRPLSAFCQQDQIDKGLSELTGRPCVCLDAQTMIRKDPTGDKEDEVIKYIKERLTGGK